MKRLLFTAVSGALALNPTGAARSEVSCAAARSFADPHLVLEDSAKALLWVRPLQVDADGAPNAYHRDDPHGTKGLAIEYLGNGMTIERDGKAMPFKLKEADNTDWLSAYRAIVQNGWEAPPRYSVDIYGFARDRAGNVCVGRDGRLVSSTSLVLRPRRAACDQSRYVDALSYPGIVVPNRGKDEDPVERADPEVAPPFAQRGVRRGDLAVVYNPETGLWKGALVYDTGPRHLLGEGSIRLVMNLRGLREVPTSAVATNSIGIVETFTVLFPGSVADLGPARTWSPQRVERAAAARFRDWGGGSVAGALDRLLACAAEYKSRR